MIIASQWFHFNFRASLRELHRSGILVSHFDQLGAQLVARIGAEPELEVEAAYYRESLMKLLSAECSDETCRQELFRPVVTPKCVVDRQIVLVCRPPSDQESTPLSVCTDLLAYLGRSFPSMQIDVIPAIDSLPGADPLRISQLLQTAAVLVCADVSSWVYATLLQAHSALVIIEVGPPVALPLVKLHISWIDVSRKFHVTLPQAGADEFEDFEGCCASWVVNVPPSFFIGPDLVAAWPFTVVNSVQSALEEATEGGVEATSPQPSVKAAIEQSRRQAIAERAAGDSCPLDAAVVRQPRYTLHHTHYLLVPWLVSRLHVTSYLEIGVRRNHLFDLIPISDKIGVDMKRGGNRRMTSDQYFAEAKAEGKKFGFIFIDGDHSAEQVHKDVTNALSCLSPGGVIMLHDCHPPTLWWEHSDRSGDNWKAILALRLEAQTSQPEWGDLDIAVGDFDTGLGVIMKRPAPLSRIDVHPAMREALLSHRWDEVPFSMLEDAATRTNLLNLKSSIPGLVEFVLNGRD